MLNLYSISVKNEYSESSLTQGELLSVVYHDIFDYPLDFADLIKWKAADEKTKIDKSVTVRNGYVYLSGRDGLVYKKLLRNRISQKKLEIANKVAKILSFVPTIKMVALTGSLAMNNSTEHSDIDFLIVTKSNTLWTTRLFSILLLKFVGVKIRSPYDKEQRDKICLNMWLDEDKLAWEYEKSLYTAHEIAQVRPLYSKNKTYEFFLSKNKWILNFWPNSVKVKDQKFFKKNKTIKIGRIFNRIEKLMFNIQYRYMKNKITNEKVKRKIALFHPQDWGEIILKRLSS